MNNYSYTNESLYQSMQELIYIQMYGIHRYCDEGWVGLSKASMHP